MDIPTAATRIEPMDDALALITATQKTALETQFENARMYPRDEAAAMKRIVAVATQSEEVAEECMYSLPQRKGSDDRIEGPSVRLAEIVVSQWGNLMVGSRVTVIDEKMITAEGIGIDLQSNNAVSMQVRRRITTKEGKRYGDDMITVTGNAACAIAYRNVVYKLVPAALVQPAYEAVKKAALGEPSEFKARRDKVIQRLKDTYHISLARILYAAGVEEVEEIGPAQLEILIGCGTTLKSKDHSVDQIFPPPGREQAENLQTKLDDLPDSKLADPTTETPTASPTAPTATSPVTDEPTPKADEVVPPQASPETEPAAPVGGGLMMFPAAASILNKAADLLAERSGQSRKICAERITSYITKTKYRGTDLSDVTEEQAAAIMIDIKIVVDVSTIK